MWRGIWYEYVPILLCIYCSLVNVIDLSTLTPLFSKEVSGELLRTIVKKST